jgi:serine/threonine-protein kinase
MGVVYRAQDTLLEREVALKIISASIEEHPELRERFFREARGAGQLSHRNIITIHDLGEHEGQPYLAMELLKGEDLQHRLTRPDPMSLARKLEIASEICDGLAYAHRRGLVHRDIKPANIFITDEGVVKILDFGLARMVTSELTKSNMMLGTLNYMAPEQVRGERTDHRADIFSFGVVLYEILSGRKAFQGDSYATTLYKILQDVPEPLRNIDATLPHEVVRLVERAIAKGREDRYQDLSELSKDLALQRQHLAVANVATMAVPAPTSYHDAEPTMPGGTRAPEPIRPKSSPRALDPDAATGMIPLPDRRPPRRILAAGAGLALIALFGTAFWLSRRDGPPALQPAVESTAPQTAPAPTPTPPSPAPGPPAPAAAGASAPAAAAATRPVTIDTQAVEDARTRMVRAKAAARQAGSRAQRSPSFAAALAAERDGLRFYQSKQLADAAAKFYEATGLFRIAEVTSAVDAPAAATVAEAPREPAPLPPPTASAPASAPAPVSPAPGSSPPAAATPPPPEPAAPARSPAAMPAAPIPPATRPSAPSTAPAESTKPEDGVRDLVRRYEQALEARSVEAVKRLWPSLQGAQEEAIRREFTHARRIDVEIAGIEIAVAGSAATVTFLRRYQLSTVDGQRLLTNSRTTLNARRNGDDWLIERVRFEAVK